jgi:methylglutaconyl-CoA hydratase
MADPTATYSTLEVTVAGAIARVALNRPDVHNAFDETLIAELTHVVRTFDADTSIRVLVLEGRGQSFCAGADLNWMKKMAAF